MREGEQTGGRTGPGGRGREGGREGALPRELLRTVLALAGGQRVRDGRADTRTGHCTRQGSSGALRHAPAPRLGSLRASPRGPTGDKPVARARQRRRPGRPRIRGAMQWVSARSHGCELMH